MSAFSALSSVLGGNLGTGNIAGTAIALSTGGPGALFWMWIMAIIGAIIKYSGCYLAILYRQPVNGNFAGGPMYYLRDGLKAPYTASAFAIITVISAMTVGNFVQINSVTIPLISHGIDIWLICIVMIPLLAWVIFDSQKRFTRFSSFVVPLMAIIYLGLCLWVIGLNIEKIPGLFSLIITSAFSTQSFAGGLFGYGMFDGLRVGFDRGLFATDAGIGIAPMLHAEIPDRINQKETAREQGLVSIFAPFVVMLICLMTGLVILITQAWLEPNLESTKICMYAFKTGTGVNISQYALLLTLFLFASTTLLTWSYCAERALVFLGLQRYINLFRFVYIFIIPVGMLVKASWIWAIADISINLMLIINLVAVYLLSKKHLAYDHKLIEPSL